PKSRVWRAISTTAHIYTPLTGCGRSGYLTFNNAHGEGANPLNAELLRVDEAAAELRIGRSTMYRLIREGRIGYTPVSDGKKLISRQQIADYIAAIARPPDHTNGE